MTQTQQLNPQIFTVWSDEIEGRIDPSFYHPDFIKFEKALANLKSVKILEEISKYIGSGSTPLAGSEAYTLKGSGIPFIRITNLKDGRIDLSNVLYIKPEIHNEMLKRTKLKSGDILLSMAGTIGLVAVVGDDIKEANINQALARIVLKDNYNRQYIATILSSKVGEIQTNRLSRPSVQANLNLDEIKSLKIPLPPPSTQTKIVNIMAKAYEEKRQKQAEAKRLLNSIDDYVLAELGIKMPEIKREMVFEVSSDKVENNRVDAEYWQPFLEKIEQVVNKSKCKIQKLKNFITKIHYGASTSNAYVDDGIPFLRILNLKPNHLNLSDIVYLPENFRKVLGNAFVATGDLLISRSGTVGVVSVIPEKANGFAFGSFMIRFCLDDKINKEFVSIWLNNKLNKLLTEREKIGAIQGNITIGTIENFKIPIPPLLIQKKIAEKVELRYFQAQMLQNQAEEVLKKAKEKAEAMILG